MRRRLFPIVTLALCAAKLLVVVLWAASLFRYDLLSYRSASGARTLTAIASDGGFGLTATRWTPNLPGEPLPVEMETGWRWSSLPHVGRGGLGFDPLHRAPNLLGVGVRLETIPQFGGDSRRAILVAPFWFLLALLAIPSLLLARRAVRDRIASGRVARGRCPACGYDLRGTADPGGPCPECGAASASGGVSSARPTATAAPTPAATAASAR